MTRFRRTREKGQCPVPRLRQTPLTTTLNGAPVYLNPDPGGNAGNAVQITFSLTVPEITTPDGYSVSGGLDFSVAGPPPTAPPGWDIGQQQAA
jgi:hypothetical protein